MSRAPTTRSTLLTNQPLCEGETWNAMRHCSTSGSGNLPTGVCCHYCRQHDGSQGSRPLHTQWETACLHLSFTKTQTCVTNPIHKSRPAAPPIGEPESCPQHVAKQKQNKKLKTHSSAHWFYSCLLYTSPSPRDISGSRMPSSA